MATVTTEVKVSFKASQDGTTLISTNANTISRTDLTNVISGSLVLANATDVNIDMASINGEIIRMVFIETDGVITVNFYDATGTQEHVNTEVAGPSGTGDGTLLLETNGFAVNNAEDILNVNNVSGANRTVRYFIGAV